MTHLCEPWLWDDFTGFEVRVDGARRSHHRLFCLLDYDAAGRAGAVLVVIDGRSKPFRTTLTEAEYTRIRALGAEYRSRNPRNIV